MSSATSTPLTPSAMTPGWSNAHDQAAAAEGWCISETSGSDNGRWQIQHFDDASDIGPGTPQLESDEQAWKIALEGALPHHKAAVQFIKAHSPEEYEALMVFAATLRPTLVATKHGTFAMVHDGQLIENPAMRKGESGEPPSPVSPAHYGFQLWETGGGFTAWGAHCKLEDGTHVQFMVTQDGDSVIDPSNPVDLGVTLEEGFGFVEWTLAPGADSVPYALQREGDEAPFAPQSLSPRTRSRSLGR